MLSRLIGVEEKVWLQVADLDKIWPIADEDLERTDAEKTSAVRPVSTPPTVIGSVPFFGFTMHLNPLSPSHRQANHGWIGVNSLRSDSARPALLPKQQYR